MPRGDLNEKGIPERWDICTYRADFTLLYSRNTTLQSNYTPIKINSKKSSSSEFSPWGLTHREMPAGTYLFGSLQAEHQALERRCSVKGPASSKFDGIPYKLRQELPLWAQETLICEQINGIVLKPLILNGLLCVCSVVSNFAAPQTAACQAPLPIELSRQEYWSGLPFPCPRNLTHKGIQPVYPVSLALASGFFTSSMTWEAHGLLWSNR